MSLPDVSVDESEMSDRMNLQPFYRRHAIPVLLVLSVLLLLPILIWGFPARSHDGAIHIQWQYFYGKQLWAGDLFPRWLLDSQDGFGSPAFFIYPPLPHYVAALLTPLSDGTYWVKHRLAIGTVFACFLGSVGCFLWLKQITREYKASLIGAIVYMTAPYHLFVDSYWRAAYAELWALAFAPFTLAAIHLLTSQRRIGITLYILSVSGLLMSHAPSALILIPLFFVYSLIMGACLGRISIVVWTIIASCSAALIACIYLGTALTQQGYINTDGLYSGYFNFYNWLFFQPSSPSPKRYFAMVGLLQAAITVLLAGSLLVTRKYQKEWLWLAVAAFTGTCFLFFMMTSFSAAVWSLIPFAQKIQFPWRLQTAQTLLLALSATLFLRAVVPTFSTKLLWGYGRSIDWIGWLLVLMLIFLNSALLLRVGTEFDIAAPMRTYETPEYTLGDHIGGAKIFPGGDKALVIAGTSSLKLLRWEPRHIEFEIDSLTTAEVLIRQFTYSGWVCHGSLGVDTCRVLSNKTGEILHVLVTPGKQRLKLTMPETKPEVLGKIASIVGLIIAVMSIFAGGMHWGRAASKDTP